jgi:hypothetical protein
MIVYRYALAAPSENFEQIFDQLRAAHEYRNELISIERARRQASRALIDGHSPVATSDALALVAAASIKLEKTVDELRKERSRTRKRSESPELRERIRLARKELALARKCVYDLRRAAQKDPAVAGELGAIRERAKELIKGARALTRCYWGTYLTVEAAMQASVDSLPLYDFEKPNDPSFVRWRGVEGSLSVQLQGGLESEKACSGRDTRVRLRMPDYESSFVRENRDGTRKTRKELEQARRLGELRLRVCSDERGSPVWGTWRMDAHRPLPDHSRIKWATVHATRCGPITHWHLTLTLDVPPKPLAVPAERGQRKLVGVDIGWRWLGEAQELRVACISGSDGHSEELRLSSLPQGRRRKLGVYARLRAIDEVRSHRDHRFDMIRMRLKRWAAVQISLPAWLSEELKTMHAWRSFGRLTSVVSKWRQQRFPGDEIIFSHVSGWADQDLYDWKTQELWRGTALRYRREIYRIFAARLAQRYDVIVLETFDLRKFAERQLPEGEGASEFSRSHRHMAALNELRLAIINAAKTRRKIVVKLNAADTTKTCPSCGTVEEFDKFQISRTCGGCGTTWDQDDSASIVLRTRYAVSPNSAIVIVGNEKEDTGETRWAKVARLKKEKQATSRASSDIST